MRNPKGYGQIFFPDGSKESIAAFDDPANKVRVTGSMYEVDTFRCEHCGGVVHVPAKADVNFVGMCRNCMKPICQKCSAQPCIPFERKLVEAEERGRTLRSYGLED